MTKYWSAYNRKMIGGGYIVDNLIHNPYSKLGVSLMEVIHINRYK